MNQTPDQQERARRRWINLGEFIALGALVISGLGLWINWQERKSGPTEVIEKTQAVPLVLRGKVEEGGRRLIISPVEDSHALESLTLVFPNGKAIEIGGDGELNAGAVESALGDSGKRSGTASVTAKIEARYVEAGTERLSKRPYLIRYRWEGGGLFGGKSLRMTGLTRG